MHSTCLLSTENDIEADSDGQTLTVNEFRKRLNQSFSKFIDISLWINFVASRKQDRNSWLCSGFQTYFSSSNPFYVLFLNQLCRFEAQLWVSRGMCLHFLCHLETIWKKWNNILNCSVKCPHSFPPLMICVVSSPVGTSHWLICLWHDWLTESSFLFS